MTLNDIKVAVLEVVNDYPMTPITQLCGSFISPKLNLLPLRVCKCFDCLGTPTQICLVGFYTEGYRQIIMQMFLISDSSGQVVLIDV